MVRTVTEWCPLHGHGEFFESPEGLCCPVCYTDELADVLDYEAEQLAPEYAARATYAGVEVT